MTAMEGIFKEACEKGEIRGAVLLAASTDGTLKYKNAFGQASPSKAMTLESTFRLASCSKLITSIAALQCVERGQITLDEDVAPILHELKDISILKGFAEGSGEPVLEMSRKTITLRHLLTHTCGMSYDFANPLLIQWREYHHQKTGIPASNFTTNYRLPLLFEPGEGWEYGAGPEWAGILVERLNRTNLQSYLERNVWGPLGIKNMTFHLEQRPDIRAKLPCTSKRDADGQIQWVEEVVIPDPIEDERGGCGIISTAQDFLKVMVSLLMEDERLLRAETVNDMFQPQLTQVPRKSLCELVKTIERSTGFGLPQGIAVDHGLAGILNMEDLHTGRTSGSLSWGGYPNLKWWIDRQAGICGLYASQLHPPGDPTSVRMYEVFQAEMYHRLHRHL